MINANEARQLVDESDKTVNDILNKLDLSIRMMAARGERLYACYNEVAWCGKPIGQNPVPTDLHNKLIAKLKSLGFGAKYSFHGDSYIPRGLMEDDGTGPLHINHVLIVTW